MAPSTVSAKTVRMILIAWYYFVAAMAGLHQGELPKLRQVGPFNSLSECNAARRAENPKLWRSDDCISDDLGDTDDQPVFIPSNSPARLMGHPVPPS